MRGSVTLLDTDQFVELCFDLDAEYHHEKHNRLAVYKFSDNKMVFDANGMIFLLELDGKN